jgi:hypothetical protein
MRVLGHDLIHKIRLMLELELLTAKHTMKVVIQCLFKPSSLLDLWPVNIHVDLSYDFGLFALIRCVHLQIPLRPPTDRADTVST